MTQKLGIMGGTFDPVHIGHLACAEMARDACGLEEVLFVVAGDPHFKQGQSLAPAEDRLAMVQVAIASNDAFRASAMEIERSGITYTADTLAILARELTDVELSFILGTDSLVTLPLWKDAESIAQLASIICVSRPGSTIEDALLQRLEDAGFDVTFVEAPLLDISSSEVRARVTRGETIRYLVPEPVDAYIQAHGLYGHLGRSRAVGASPDPTIDPHALRGCASSFAHPSPGKDAAATKLDAGQP